MGSTQVLEYDALLVGAGFGSIATVHKLAKMGISAKIYEKGSSTGGIWYWNCYPGARVDSDSPIYQLFDEELWSTFTFKERYPGYQELRRYFNHVVEKWDLRKYMEFNKYVDSATFDAERNRWLVECSDGTETRCKWFIPCIGFAAKTYTPPIPGLSNFRGGIYHTAVWPQYGVNLKGKRIAQIGTGASGIQVIQEIGDSVKHLTIYQRTPNQCLPMYQRLLDENEEEEKKRKGLYKEAIAKTRHTFTGFDYDFLPRNTFDDSPEEREKTYHSLLMEQGGFKFWLGSYQDILFDQKANDEAYKYWRKWVHSKVKDPKKQELLAPEIPLHPIGTKRPSLVQGFYETVDQPHIDIIDINKSPIQEVTATGIRSTDEGLIEFDVIILATGFDSLTGSLAQLNIQGTNGSIAEHWKHGTRTAMGIAMSGFPNMFFLYGPQAATAFANGPSSAEYQSDWLTKFLQMADEQNIDRIEATEQSEEEWTKRVQDVWNSGLFPQAKSWYQGANIPGKKVEALNWAGGLPAYLDALDKSLENDFQGWKIRRASSA